jgi:hypothetical protein
LRQQQQQQRDVKQQQVEEGVDATGIAGII